jgi:steroid delta-isomerase-like uncharacterized protein
MSTERTREVMSRYFASNHADTSIMTDDVAFTIMATGQTHRGREDVLQMLDTFYHVAFDATAETRLTLFGDSNAMIEAEFVGRHIGEFAGIAATGRQVRVPLCVVYDLRDGRISSGRVYFEMTRLMQQLAR